MTFKEKIREDEKRERLSKAVFGIEPNNHAIYLDVKSHLANKRQGTHKAKERGEIVGSTRKIKKQKGQVRLVLGLSKILCLEVEVVFLDHVFVTTAKK